MIPTSVPTEKAGCPRTSSHLFRRSSSYPRGVWWIQDVYYEQLVGFKEVRGGVTKGKEKRASRARLHGFGCPPGIRTPIERVRVASPTIERGGNAWLGVAPRADSHSNQSTELASRGQTERERNWCIGSHPRLRRPYSTGSFARYPSRVITEYFTGFCFSSCICRGCPSLSTSSTCTWR